MYWFLRNYRFLASAYFLPCTKSRKCAIRTAASPTHLSEDPFFYHNGLSLNGFLANDYFYVSLQREIQK